MYKLSITNNVNGKKYGAIFETQEEANTWRDSCIAKESWGKNAYSIKAHPEYETSIPEGYAYSDICVISEATYDAETNELLQEQVDGIEYFYEVEYTITEEDLSQNAEFLAEQALQVRKAEYAKIDDLLKEALVERELGDSSKFDTYILLRNEIKLNNPL